MKIKMAPHQMSNTIENESVILNTLNGNYYSVKNTAQTIWTLVVSYGERGVDVSELTERVRTELPAAPTTLPEDILTFVEELRSEGLIETVLENETSP